MSKSRNLSRTKLYPIGPGSVPHRFNRLLDELRFRYPPDPALMFSSSITPEEQSLRAMDAKHARLTLENRRLREALKKAMIGLDDWINTYASEFCDEKRVEEAYKRISDNGGTIAYIADLNQLCRKALEEK